MSTEYEARHLNTSSPSYISFPLGQGLGTEFIIIVFLWLCKKDLCQRPRSFACGKFLYCEHTHFLFMVLKIIDIILNGPYISCEGARVQTHRPPPEMSVAYIPRFRVEFTKSGGGALTFILTRHFMVTTTRPHLGISWGYLMTLWKLQMFVPSYKKL